MEAIPENFDPIPKLPPIDSNDEPQERFVVPLSRYGEKSLAKQANDLFQEEDVDKLISAISLTSINESINMAIPHRDRQELVLSDEEVTRLARQDVQERLLDRISIHVSALSKTGVADLYSKAINEELESIRFSQRRDVNIIVLERMTVELEQKKQALQDLALEALNVSSNLLEDAQNIQQLKQELMFNAHTLASLGEATERVSPEISHDGDFHIGPTQRHMRINQGYLNERDATTYSRGSAGTSGHLLGLNIAREYGLPNRSNDVSRQVEVFSSGMGALGTVLESVEEVKPKVIMTEGTYFELPASAIEHGIIQETTPVNEDLYFKIASEIKKDSSTPLVIVGQPFGSGMEKNIFDLDRVLTIVKSTDTKRQVILVVDSTMHGATLQKWTDVKEIVDTGKDFTFIEIQSLMKHSQIGMDTVTGGMALGYGSHPEHVRNKAGSRGTIISEHNAAVLFPFSAEQQIHRVQRAGRNAEFIAKTLSEKLKDNSLFKGVHYSTESDPETAKRYDTKSPILFIELNELVPEQVVRQLMGHFQGIQRMFPESGNGTSYGFDGTRFSTMSLGPDHPKVIRIAAGQESTIQLMAITRYIEYQMNNIKLAQESGRWLQSEIDDLNRKSKPYSKEDFNVYLQFNHDIDPNSKADEHIESLYTQGVALYLKDQCRGYEIVKGLGLDQKFKDRVGINEVSVYGLGVKSLDRPEEVMNWVRQYVIIQGEFLERFRSKLAIGDKRPSLERTYQIAKAINDIKGVSILLAPVAKIMNDILKEAQPEIEALIGARLPLNF